MRHILAAAAAIVTAGFMTASVQAAEVTLRFHQFLPLHSAIPGQGIQPWIDRIEAESDGRIEIQHYPSMQLGGSPPSLYGQARDGVVDIIWSNRMFRHVANHKKRARFNYNGPRRARLKSE